MADKIPAWAWPRNIKTEPRWHVRLGRVLHWTLTGFAMAFAAGAAIVSVLYFQAEWRWKREVAAWEDRYRGDGPIYKFKSGYRDYYVSDPMGRGVEMAGKWLADGQPTEAQAGTKYDLRAPVPPALVPLAPGERPPAHHFFELIEERPVKPAPDWSVPIVVMIAAAVLALAGRGLRFIFGGE